MVSGSVVFSVNLDPISPTEVAVQLRTSPYDLYPVPQLTANASLWGFVNGKFTLKLNSVDPAFRKTLAAAFKKQNLTLTDLAGIGRVLGELQNNGVDVDGAIRLAFLEQAPALDWLLRSSFKLQLRKDGLRYSANRLVPVPPGIAASTWALGLGWSLGKLDASVGKGGVKLKPKWSFAASITPLPQAPPKLGINLFAYLDIHRIFRPTDGLEIGLRLTLAPESRNLRKIASQVKGRWNPPPSPGAKVLVDEMKNSLPQPPGDDGRHYREDFGTPWLMTRLEARFDWPFISGK